MFTLGEKETFINSFQEESNLKIDLSEKNVRDILIDLDRVKKEALTDYLSNIPHIQKIERKSFSIEGKGDLFNRYFSHFEYEILLKVK